jgi:hypothetical protein
MKRLIHQNQGLTARLSGYAAAAGTLIALAPDANSQIAYSGLQNLELNMPDEYMEIDLDTNMVTDFGFQLYGYSDSSVFGSYSSHSKIGYGVIVNPKTDMYNNSWITKMTSVRIYSTSSGSYAIQAPIVEGVKLGDMIDSDRSSWGNVSEPYWSGVLGISYSQGYNAPSGSFTAAWSAGDFKGDEKFIGVRFYIGTEQHFGWIRVSMGDELDPLTIIDWAYELAPDVRILAGDGLGIDLPPSVKITGVKSFTNSPVQTLTITTSEEVTDFEATDISITNGIAQNFTEVTAGLEYSIEITADTEGTVSIDIPDSAVYSLSDAANLATNKTWIYDHTAPQIDIEAFSTLSDQAYVEVYFNEKVIDFDVSDIQVTNGTVSDFDINIPGMEYNFNIHFLSDDVTLEIPEGAVTDLAGNENAFASHNFTVDIIPPEVILDAGITSTAEAITDVDVSFDEPVYGLYIESFVISNGAATSLTFITDFINYKLTVTADAPGQVIVALPESSVYDDANNPNGVASTSWIYQPVGLNPSSEEGFLIYPNPAVAKLHIRLAREASIKLIDLSGNIILTKDHFLDEIIDVSGFAPGVYFVQIQEDTRVTQHKIVIE